MSESEAHTFFSPLLPWEWTTWPWSRRFCRPFHESHVLISIDSHSKWMEVHMMSSITATATIQCFCSIWHVVRQWVRNSKIFYGRMGSNIHTLPYHPASDDLAEHAVQTWPEILVQGRCGCQHRLLESLRPRSFRVELLGEKLIWHHHLDCLRPATWMTRL